MGRRRSSLPHSSCNLSYPYHEAQSMESLYPTLHKILHSNEMHMFDLASAQSELERMLSTVLERLECLSAESKGKDLPENIVNLLKQRGDTAVTDINQSAFGRPTSLVVTPNPDKPLTLIISQQTRPVHQTCLPALDPSSSRKKFPPGSPSVCRVSRSSTDVYAAQASSTSPDKNQSSSSYAIPNKFWELMEPYCAEITEANISYLENLIRSYQDLETTILQPLSLNPSECRSVEDVVHSPAPKRPRRDNSVSTNHQIEDSTATTDQAIGETVVSPRVSQNLRFIESELRKPPNEACGLEKLSQSLLNSCYQENVVFSFTECIRHFSEDAKTTDDPAKTQEQSEDGSAVCSSSTSELFKTETDSNRDSSFDADSTHIGHCSAFPVLTDEIRRSISTKACQPLKALAKQMHVSSSYRVEKKIAQAMDDLGLIPLKVTHHAEPKDCADPVKMEDFFEWILRSRSRADPHPSAKTTMSTPSCPNSQPFSPNSKDNRTLLPLDTDASATSRFSSVKRRRPSFGRGLRSPTGHAKEPSPPEIAESDSHRNFSIKLEESDQLLSTNGATESGQHYSDRALRKSVRQTGCVRALRSQTNGCDPALEQLNCSPNNSHVTSPKHTREPLVNGVCFTEDEDEPDAMIAHEFDHYTSSRTGLDVTSSKRGRAETASSPGLNCVQLPIDVESDIYSTNPSFKSANSTMQSNGDVFTSDHLANGAGEEADVVRIPTSVNSLLDVNNPDGGQVAANEHSHASKPFAEDPGRIVCATSDKPFERKADNAFHFLLREFGATQDSTHKIALPVTQQPAFVSSSSSAVPVESVMDEVALAIQQRQQELRLVCAENHGVLHRLVQAARRDMQRQEIQRRLAIADADVIEAYNKLESYRPHRKPPLKRDRDSAYKALKERRKILKELEAFDTKSP
ncbi:hypothetical protein CRM22_009388 [Opisthorchis felineus]|uniref:Transcriptional adapter 3 n=1 Tax=Opisthorchis felineus TaxID=147828 RepID=A0A4S2L7V0_OPIFE|nr:hypothetical protein CRM22_009388 [Opisthorchis felineus]